MVDKAKTTKQSLRFANEGFLLGVVNDILIKGKNQFHKNVRKGLEGEIISRPTLEALLTLSPAPNLTPHTIKAILNGANFLHLAGAGTKIYTGPGGILNEKATGFSGNPLAIVDFRPENSVQAYMYVADANKFVKVGVDDTLSSVGLVAPTKAADWKIGAPNRKIIDSIEAGSETDWNNLTGSAAAPTLQTRVNTTITAYLADNALPSYASIVPAAAIPDLQPKAIVKLNGAAEVVVEDVFPAVLLAGVATISQITYDAGTTGMATIVLSVPSADIKRNTILKLVNATPTTEYVRVQDVTLNDRGIPSVRVSTVATFAVGNTITGADSFRIYTAVAYAATNTIIGKYIKTAIGAAGISSITRTFNVDLTNTGTKALTDEDIFSIAMMVSDPTKITEIQIQLDLDGTVPFTENYRYYAINPNFFQGSVSQTTPTISIIQQASQRQQLLAQQRIQAQSRIPMYKQDVLFDPSDPNIGIDYPSPVTEAIAGQNQWTQIAVALKDFKSVGADTSKTLKDVKAIRISVNATAAVDISIDSLWIGGADTLDNSDQGFLPYNYVYRLRDPTTRVISNWSPPLRSGIRISRGNVVLSFPDAAANYPITYKIDVARIGGTLSDFRVVGSILNSVAAEFTDTSSDRLIADNDLAGRFSEQGATDAIFDFFKPFAVLDRPKSGSCTIVGTKFTWISGDKLNISYPRGTQIVINGKSNLFYTNPTDDQHVELENDMGSLVTVKFEIEEPLLTGQPLPQIAGVFGEGNFGLFIFGWGDANAAGTLYWLDGNTPDTMSDTNRLEITPPSEPLMGGVMWDGYLQIYTTKQSFTILPTLSSDGEFNFVAKKNAGSRGLYSHWAIGVGSDGIYFLSENADGIYRVRGTGEPELLTVGFDNLFYANGKTPVNLVLPDGTIIYPPDFTAKTEIRIFCTGDEVVFRFKNTNAEIISLVFSIKSNAFISYDTFVDGNIGAWYKEEGESNTTVLAGVFNGVAKFGSGILLEGAITSTVIPFAFDAGDSRTLKYFYELMLSVDPGNDKITITNLIDNGLVPQANINLLGEVGHHRKQFIVNLDEDVNGQGISAQNLATKFSWTVVSGAKLYEEVIYFEPYADIITDRSGDVTTGGTLGEKLWQGIIIQTDTFGADKILKFIDDHNVVRAQIPINHTGFETIAYSFDQPFISHTITRTSDDEVEWIAPQEVYVFDNEPEAAKVWEGEFNNSDLSGLILIKRLGIAFRSTEEATIKFFFDDGTELQYTILASGGDFSKLFLYVAAKKFKACKYRIESTEPIRIYKKHCEVDIKSFNSSQGFVKVKPFGGDSNVTDIRI